VRGRARRHAGGRECVGFGRGFGHCGETFLSDWSSKPYKAKDCGFSFSSVRMIDFLVQFFWGGGAVSVAYPAAWRHLRCKILRRSRVVTQNARAATFWSCRPRAIENTPAANSGTCPYLNDEPKTPFDINGLKFGAEFLDTVEKLCFQRRTKNCSTVGSRFEKSSGREAEVDLEKLTTAVAGQRWH
jgi:hypothetical protein